MATSTCVSKGKGAAVVKEVVDTINSLGIFANDHKFLCRVAWVESKYGEDSGTYRSGYHGGIWQIMLLTVVLICLLGQIFVKSVACDDPFTPEGKGNAVVTEVVDMINHLGIFPSDRKFLCRVAWVESKYGEAPGTYRQGYYGGIWQVDEIGYRETVSQQGLKKYWDQIKAKLDIDWTETEWEDLEKPLYSGLAARLFLARISAPIPKDLSAQAQYWKKYYNTLAGKGTVQKFIDDVKHATGCAV